MRPTRRLSRRSFLLRVVGASALGGSLSLIGGEAGALQVTDTDPSDPIGRGRGSRGGGGGGVYTGYTDSDSGPGADRVGHGRRGTAQQQGVTDSDPNDPVGRGRGSRPPINRIDSDDSDRGQRVYTGHSDTDRGRDPEGYGRVQPRRPYTGVSDTDRGQDAQGYGRRPAGVTDSDPSDPWGRGRGGSCTDSDRSPAADPVGRGRRC